MHNLTGVLETAIRATNAQYADPEIIERLDCRLLEVCQPKLLQHSFATFEPVVKQSGLSLGFHSPVALIFTPITIWHFKVSATAKFTCNNKGP